VINIVRKEAGCYPSSFHLSVPALLQKEVSFFLRKKKRKKKRKKIGISSSSHPNR